MPTTKLDLLDRYLNAVKFWLPKAQQQDIIAELSEELHSRIEEREVALGREVAEDDLVDILKEHGSPLRVASGYLPEQRLISPVMLPTYRLVLKIVLLWVLAPLFAIIFIGALPLSVHPGRVLLLGFEAWRAGFMAVGIITTVFILSDRYQSKIASADKWDPRKLPRVPAKPVTPPRWVAIAGFALGAVTMGFWLYVMWNRTEFSIPGGPRIILGPIWKYVYWLLPGLTMTGASFELLSVLRPSWTRVRCYVTLGIDVCMLAMVAIMMKLDNWVTIAGPNLSAEELVKVMTWVNLSIEVTLISFAVIPVGDAIAKIILLRRAKPAMNHPWQTGTLAP